MPDEREIKEGSWVMYFTVAILSLPVWYALSSGPMKIGFEKFGFAPETHEHVYTPLVWLSENTLANGPVDWYWGLFPTRYERELMGKYYLPKVRTICRNLGVED